MYKFLMLIACGLSLNAQMLGGVSIIVKDKAITLYDIQKEMRETQTDAGIAANALVRQKLEEIEMKERRINVSSGEVYDDIKETAKRNNMSVNDFYEAALNARGISSQDLKAKVRQKLLRAKLYSAIAYSKLKPPSDKDIQDYYTLNKSLFNHPSSFDVTIYQTKDKQALIQKTQNPMHYSPKIQEIEQVLPYNRIAPELAQLLSKTPLNSFTPIVPDGKGGHMSFYLFKVADTQEMAFKDVKKQVQNTMLAKKRENVLKDHFKRLRENTDIKVLRQPN